MGKTSSKIAVIAALTTVWPTFATPQQSGLAGQQGLPAGRQVDLDLSTGLIVDDNFNLTSTGRKGTSLIWDTKLGFTFSNVTPLDTLVLRGTGVLRFADLPGRRVTGFESPDLRLTYTRDGLNSRLALNARYMSANRDFLDPFSLEREEQQTGTLIGGGGTLEVKSASLSYQTGLQSTLGFAVTLSHDERDYSGTTSSSLYDTTTDSLRTVTSFRPNQVTQLSVNAGVSHYQAGDLFGTDRMTTDLSFGWQQEINPVLLLDAQLGYSQIETDYSLPFPSTTRRGGVGSVTLSKTVPDGTIWASLGSALTVSGNRQTLRFGRDYQLPSGSLSLAMGLTSGPNGQDDVIGSLAYSHQMKDSDLTFRLDRAATTSSASEDVLDTRLTLGYGYQINAVSRIDLTANYGVSENDTTGITVTRATLRGAYAQQLTSDWSLVGGVQFRSYDETGSGTAHSKQIFLTLDRTFSYRP